jgi:hypothetical protein
VHKPPLAEQSSLLKSKTSVMKKNLIPFSIILFVFVWITSCKKESSQSTSTGETNDLQVGNNSSCKLTQNAWGSWYTWNFHYDGKGLADEWKIDFGGGYFWNFKMEYDKFNNLIEATGYDPYDNKIIVTSFTYSGNQIIKQIWTDLQGGPSSDVRFSHNTKGQMIKVEDILNDTHVFLTYDDKGNWIRSDYYIGSDIYYSDIYEYGIQARNSLLTVSGVDWPFPYYGGAYFQKLCFSRNLSIVYDGEANQFVVNDLNASNEDVTTSLQNFPASIHYFDETSQAPFDLSFGYSCNGNSDISSQTAQGNRTTNTSKTSKRLKPTLSIGRSIKEQLQELRKEYTK